MKSCVECKHFNICEDTNKGFGHSCSNFSRMKTVRPGSIIDMMMDGEDGLDDGMPPARVTESTNDRFAKYLHMGADELRTTESGLIQMVDEVMLNPSPVLPDLKFDDRDLKEFKNVLHWAIDPMGANQPPFSRQIAIGLHLFAEFCPRCSHERARNIYTIPYRSSVEKLQENVVTLEHGVCPKCKVQRAELIRKKELKWYTDFAGCLGQRAGKCLVEGTLILTDDGVIPIEDVLSEHSTGFSEYKGTTRVVLEDGTKAEISHNYVEAKRQTLKVHLANGMSVEGTLNHPIMTQHGWRTLQNLEPGTALPIFYGQKAFGKKRLNVAKVNSDTEAWYTESAKTSRKSLTRVDLGYTGLVDEALAAVIGYWVSEGCGGRVSITNQDPQILDLCQSVLSRLYGADAVIRKTEYVECRRYMANHHFNILLGGTLNQKSAGKRIPQHILSSPKTIQRAFLSALFEGDGTVYRNSIEYSSISRKLIEELLTVLHNFGIPCRATKGKTWATNGSPDQKSKDVWYLRIDTRSGILAFSEEIGFVSKRKQSKLALACSSRTDREKEIPFWDEKTPESVKVEFLRLLELIQVECSKYQHQSRYIRVKGSLNQMLGVDDPSWRIYSPNVALSRQRIVSTFSTLRSSGLWGKLGADIRGAVELFEEKYAKGKVYWVGVQTIVKSKSKKTTYDFTIPSHHRFMANGILSHNSATIYAYIAPYIIHKYLKLQNPCRVFGIMENSIISATFVGLTFARAVSLLWAPLHNIIGKSEWFCLAEGTPVTMADGTTKPIEETLGLEVKTFEGSGLVTTRADTGVKDCLELELESGHSLVGTAEHRIRCLSADGASLIWKTLGELTAEDFVVIDGVEVKLSKVKSKTPVGPKKVYDIEVEGDHNYYAGGILTHNCEYHQMLDGYATKYGIENLYSFKETFIKYMHRNMFLYPLGPNKRTLRGDNRFFAAIDELGWFYMGSDDDEERERASGKEVWTSLDRSMKTVRTAGKRLIYDTKSGKNFNTLPGAYLCGVSSPSHAKDMIMSLCRTHEDSDEVLTLHLPSWQYNPLYESKDDFAKEYREDAVRAERDFGANPPDAINPFFSDVSATQKAFNGETNKLGYEYTLGDPPEDSNLNGIAQYKWASLFNIRTGTQVPVSLLTLDAGQTNNSFCMSLLTRDSVKQKGVRPKIRVPVIIEIAPRKGKEVINFTKVYNEVIKPIIKEFNVGYVVADRWQSTKVLQDIEDDFKIPTQVYSLKYGDMTTVRSYLVSDDAPILLPPPEVPFKDIRGLAELDYPHGFQYKPVAHLYHQFSTIRGFPRSVEKGEGQTDDIWRALALGLTFLVDDEWCVKHLKGRARSGRGALGVMGTYAGSGGGQGTSSNVGSVGTSSGGNAGSSGGSSGVFARR
jgi:intein/homing endonuclease